LAVRFDQSGRGLPRLVARRPGSRPVTVTSTMQPPPQDRHSGVSRLMRTVEAIITGYERLSRLDRGRPPVRPVNRDRSLVIEEVRDEAVDVRSLILVAPDGAELPAWHPGAHLDVLLPSGRMRQYSLSGDPADRHQYRIAVRRLDAGKG